MGMNRHCIGQWSAFSGQRGPATAVSAWFEELYREEVRRQ